MSKTYVSQQFFNHRHKIYQKKGFVISNTHINISFKTDFRRFYPFLIEKYRQKFFFAYFCNFKPDVFYIRALGHIVAKLRGGSYVTPPLHQ